MQLRSEKLTWVLGVPEDTEFVLGRVVDIFNPPVDSIVLDSSSTTYKIRFNEL